MFCNKKNWRNCPIYKHGVKREGCLFRCEFDPETAVALEKRYAGVWCTKDFGPLAVFTAYHADEGRCFSTLNVGDYEEEMKCMLEECQDQEYTEEEIAPFLEKCAALKIGESASMGPWKIELSIMSKAEFEKLPEWDGW